MTTTAFVRPDAAECAAIAKRLNSVLTPEGARAWYSHDVAELLQEVVLLRQERQEAVDSFTEHMTDKPDEETPLPILADSWRAYASGYWEKAQTRRMREQLSAYEATISKLTANEGVLEARLAELISAQEQANADYLAKEIALQRAVADHAELLAVETQAKNDALSRLAQIDSELAAARKQGTEDRMAEALNAEQERAKTRAIVQQLLEALS